MEQIFMIEVFVKSIAFKEVMPEKDEYELRLEAEELKREAESLAAAEAAKGKKGKKGKAAKKPPKKGKKGKEPPAPSLEEIKFLETCTVQMSCLPLFDFYIAHDNFIQPPPPPPPPKKGKKDKPKKLKKNAKPAPIKIILPSEPLPQPPYFGVGNAVVFIARPSEIIDMFQTYPIDVLVWNRKLEMECIGNNTFEWDNSFYNCLKAAGELNPVPMDKGLYRSTFKAKIITNTVQTVLTLQCAENLRPSGEVDIVIKLSCLGNSIVSEFVTLPESDLIPGRKYLYDEDKTKDLEVVRHWEGTDINELPPVAYLFGAPDILAQVPVIPEPVKKVYDKYIIAHTTSEQLLLKMGYPKTNCWSARCKRLGLTFSDQKIKPEVPPEESETKEEKTEKTKPKRPYCPSYKLKKPFVCNESTYNTCHKPCCDNYLLKQNH